MHPIERYNQCEGFTKKLQLCRNQIVHREADAEEPFYCTKHCEVQDLSPQEFLISLYVDEEDSDGK